MRPSPLQQPLTAKSVRSVLTAAYRTPTSAILVGVIWRQLALRGVSLRVASRGSICREGGDALRRPTLTCTYDEAADLLGFSRRTIDRLIKTGELTPLRFDGEKKSSGRIPLRSILDLAVKNRLLTEEASSQVYAAAVEQFCQGVKEVF